MSRQGNGSTENGSPRRPQLQMWEDEGREAAIGRVEAAGTLWDLYVLIDLVSSDLARGRLSFRSGEERYDTAPVLVEESVEDVVRRATELSGSMLRQMLGSLRG